MFMGFSRVAQGLIPSSLSRYSSAGISAASTVSKRSSAQTASGSHGESERWVNHPELNFLGWVGRRQPQGLDQAWERRQLGGEGSKG